MFLEYSDRQMARDGSMLLLHICAHTRIHTLKHRYKHGHVDLSGVRLLNDN